MSISLALGETTVTLPDPSPGYPVRAHKYQVVGRTAGGAIYVYDKGIERFEVELPFESLTDAEKTALSDFFDDTAKASLNTFTYTDSGGNEFTARFLDPHLAFIKVSGNVWDVRLRLELNSMGR